MTPSTVAIKLIELYNKFWLKPFQTFLVAHFNAFLFKLRST